LLSSNKKENGKFLVVDVGAYSIKGTVFGESVHPVELRSSGFDRGYITDAKRLREKLGEVIENVSRVYSGNLEGLPVIFTVSFRDTEIISHEETITSSPKITGEHILRIKNLMENSVKNTYQKEILWFEVVEYKILNFDNQKIEVENPEGLSAKSLTARGFFLLVPRSIFSDFESILREIKDKYRLGKLYIFDSSISLAYGLKEDFEDFDLLDIGHTSTRLVGIRYGKIASYRIFSLGGIHIYNALKSMGILNAEQVLQTIFSRENTKVTNVDPTVLENAISVKLAEISGKISNMFPVILSGGFARLGNRFKILLESALGSRVVQVVESPMAYIGRGASKMVMEGVGNGHRPQGFTIPKSFSDIIGFIKREIMGKEE
jgi:Actin-like ATPase involved in cell division